MSWLFPFQLRLVALYTSSCFIPFFGNTTTCKSSPQIVNFRHRHTLGGERNTNLFSLLVSTILSNQYHQNANTTRNQQKKLQRVFNLFSIVIAFFYLLLFHVSILVLQTTHLVATHHLAILSSSSYLDLVLNINRNYNHFHE